MVKPRHQAMNILIINPILITPPENGGIVPKPRTIKHTLIYNYCLGFIHNGHNITLIASSEYQPSEENHFDFPIIFLKNTVKEKLHKFPNGFPLLSGLYEYLKKHHHNFDIIISSEAFTYNSFIASLICPQKLVIWQEVGQHAPTFHRIPSKIWHNIIVRTLYRNVLIIPRSETARGFIGRYANRVSKTIVDHGINIDNFSFCAEKGKYFIVVAQLIKRKNINLTIRKFKEFDDRYGGGYKLYIAGQGEEEHNLLHLISSLNLDRKVFLTGFLNHIELSNLLHKASCFLTDTSWEFNAVSILETIASGTPIITNTNPYAASYIQAKQLGIVRDDWGADDIHNLLQHHTIYIENCRTYRNKLSNDYLSELMIKTFQNEQLNNK